MPRAWILGCLSFVLGCGPAPEGEASSLEAAFGETDGEALFAAADCVEADLCTGPAPSVPQCFASANERGFEFETLQTFHVPRSGEYSFVRLGLRRIFARQETLVQVRIVDISGGLDGLATAPVLATGTLATSLVGRVSGWNTVRFDPPATLVAGSGSTPSNALHITVPAGRGTVGLACAQSADAVPSGRAYLRRVTKDGSGGRSVGAWRVNIRDLSVALGDTGTLPGPCSGTVGATCDDGDTTSGDGCSNLCAPESGFTCTGHPSTCTEADECATNTDTCTATEACTNTPGSFTCTPCPAGHRPDAAGTACVDIDECAEGSDDCDVNATCANTTGAYTCTCLGGFTGDGRSCTNVDECSAGTDDCSAYASCTDTPGAYTCACNAGYTGDGRTCTNCTTANQCTLGQACVTGICGTCSNDTQCATDFRCDAGTCRPKTCKALDTAYPALSGVATYSIRPNSTTFTAYCDLTTGNSGWTGLITTNDTSLAYLRRFDRPEDTIGSTYVTDASYGVNWGTFVTDPQWPQDLYRVRVTFPYDQVRVEYTGFNDSPAGGLGRMTIVNDLGQNIIAFTDGNTSAASGQSLVVGSTTIFSGSATNVVNRTDVVTRTGSTQLRIAMNAYTSSYAYTRRYIRQLWMR